MSVRESGGVFQEQVGEVGKVGEREDGDVGDVCAREEGGLEMGEGKGWVDGDG